MTAHIKQSSEECNDSSNFIAKEMFLVVVMVVNYSVLNLSVH